MQPIVLDVDGRILDGRNRYAACELVSVEPEFVTYDGDDPDGYALAVNIARRHLTKGQQAIVTAKARSVYSVNSLRGIAEAQGISATRISQANQVLEYAPDLADAVADGTKPLNEAYKAAQQRKQGADADESKMADLRDQAPDLADQVTEERLSLNEAVAALDSRKQEHERQQRVETNLLCEHMITISQMRGHATGWKYQPHMSLPGRHVTRKVLEDAATAAHEILTVFQQRGLE